MFYVLYFLISLHLLRGVVSSISCSCYDVSTVYTLYRFFMVLLPQQFSTDHVPMLARFSCYWSCSLTVRTAHIGLSWPRRPRHFSYLCPQLYSYISGHLCTHWPPLWPFGHLCPHRPPSGPSVTSAHIGPRSGPSATSVYIAPPPLRPFGYLCAHRPPPSGPSATSVHIAPPPTLRPPLSTSPPPPTLRPPLSTSPPLWPFGHFCAHRPPLRPFGHLCAHRLPPPALQPPLSTSAPLRPPLSTSSHPRIPAKLCANNAGMS